MNRKSSTLAMTLTLMLLFSFLGAKEALSLDRVKVAYVAIMNFAPAKLELPAGVVVSNEDLAARLATLVFRLSHG